MSLTPADPAAANHCCERRTDPTEATTVAKDGDANTAPKAPLLSTPPGRTRYYQESREGKYRGPLFVFTHTLFSIPLSLISVFAGATIIYAGTGLRADWQRWATFCGVMWCLYALAEQQTVALMMVVRSSFSAFRWSACILSLCAALASGTVRSLVVLPDWTYYLTYATLQVSISTAYALTRTRENK
ncbi:hypothetical protein HPB51_002180 [Rhipicephalus microplus]|uniref:Uncharacterized protein n=1 Tax=Rhipicephalus microplus TaxID=6941 RepID=A0A9J6EKB2_RHIMP|nr:hypothetical protein HPB51_002180 [Rhipicephalus microplus]